MSQLRGFVTAPTEGAAYARARPAARLAFSDQGITGAALRLEISCRPNPGNRLSPGSVVTAKLHIHVDLPLMPDALSGSTPRIGVDAVHQEPYGTFSDAVHYCLR